MRLYTLTACVAMTWLPVQNALSWGDEGHRVVALVAKHYLAPSTKARVAALLARDNTGLTRNRSMGEEATWADRYRDSDRDTTRVRYNQTHLWHFADIEVHGGTLDAACFGFPPLPGGIRASSGPPRQCVVAKIDQFARELADTHTNAQERLRALQFLLHFVGDVHQPLHASDDHDEGGNSKIVFADGTANGKLHHYWDSELVRLLGKDEKSIADTLIAGITSQQTQDWSAGDASAWAIEAHEVGVRVAYALPSPLHGHYHLDANYIAQAREAAALQLSRAGIRLAHLLNQALP